MAHDENCGVRMTLIITVNGVSDIAIERQPSITSKPPTMKSSWAKRFSAPYYRARRQWLSVAYSLECRRGDRQAAFIRRPTDGKHRMAGWPACIIARKNNKYFEAGASIKRIPGTSRPDWQSTYHFRSALRRLIEDGKGGCRHFDLAADCEMAISGMSEIGASDVIAIS